jgi:hypothetical protein
MRASSRTRVKTREGYLPPWPGTKWPGTKCRITIPSVCPTLRTCVFTTRVKRLGGKVRVLIRVHLNTHVLQVGHTLTRNGYPTLCTRSFSPRSCRYVSFTSFYPGSTGRTHALQFCGTYTRNYTINVSYVTLNVLLHCIFGNFLPNHDSYNSKAGKTDRLAVVRILN